MYSGFSRAPPTHPHAPISRSTHTRTHSTHAHTHAKVKDAATVVPSPLLLHARVSSRRVPRYGSAPFLFHRCQKNNYHEKRITSKTQMQTFHHEVDTMVRGEKPCERKKNNARAYLLHVQRLPCLPHTHTPRISRNYIYGYLFRGEEKEKGVISLEVEVI